MEVADTVPHSLLLDEARLRQILTNLLDNAVKFTDQGRVDLSVQCELTEAGAILVIEVADTGIGIPENQQKVIFHSLTKSDRQSVSDYSGTGMGLSIARGLAEMMNGDIRVSSEEGRGSTFRVVLRDVAISADGQTRDS